MEEDKLHSVFRDPTSLEKLEQRSWEKTLIYCPEPPITNKVLFEIAPLFPNGLKVFSFGHTLA